MHRFRWYHSRCTLLMLNSTASVNSTGLSITTVVNLTAHPWHSAATTFLISLRLQVIPSFLYLHLMTMLIVPDFSSFILPWIPQAWKGWAASLSPPMYLPVSNVYPMQISHITRQAGLTQTRGVVLSVLSFVQQPSHRWAKDELEGSNRPYAKLFHGVTIFLYDLSGN